MEDSEIGQELKLQLLFILMSNPSQQLEATPTFMYMMLKELKSLLVLKEHFMVHLLNQEQLELLQKNQILTLLNLDLMLSMEMFMMELLIDPLKRL